MLTTLRINKSMGKKTILGDPATFTITCLPKGKDTGSAKPAAGGGEGGEKKAVAEAK